MNVDGGDRTVAQWLDEQEAEARANLERILQRRRRMEPMLGWKLRDLWDLVERSVPMR